MNASNGVPVTEGLMKLIQGYMLAVLTKNENIADYFAMRVEKVDTDRYVFGLPNASEMELSTNP